MNRKVDNMGTRKYPEYGDIVCVKRAGGAYEHYAVYIGNGRVIHYSKSRKKEKLSQISGFEIRVERSRPWISAIAGPLIGPLIEHAIEPTTERGSIMEATFEDFLDGSDKYMICHFPDVHGEPTKETVSFLQTRNALGLGNIHRFLTDTKYHLYSPEETVERAKSRLGEKDYNLATNNCEYFAIWCKTGVHESHQVNSIIKAIKMPIHDF